MYIYIYIRFYIISDQLIRGDGHNDGRLVGADERFELPSAPNSTTFYKHLPRLKHGCDHLAINAK